MTIEDRVLRQLIEALLYEGIIKFEYRHHQFNFIIGDDRYTAVGYISGFGRIRLQASTIRKQNDSRLGRPSIENIVEALPVKTEVKEQLCEELIQTTKLCKWNKLHLSKPNSRRELSYKKLESTIDEGHPYHPCFKARTGFSERDHELYGPENGNTFQLIWLAVSRQMLKQNIPHEKDEDFWKDELSKKTWLTLKARMNEKNASWESFGLLPVHPWQWTKLQTNLVDLLTVRDLIHLGSAGDKYQASISVRTLINVSRPKKANIKLPLSMVNTSSLRIFESHSVCTAPVISRWLNTLVQSDSFFRLRNNLSILSEYAGIVLTNEQQGHKSNWPVDLDGQLGVIFRESMEKRHDNENAIPFCALYLMEADGKPFIDPWIKQYGCKEWLERLFETAIVPVWHLLVHHGIGIEAHAQNMLLEHRKGWPEKIILRDFHESMEYVSDYINNPALIPNFKKLEKCYSQAPDNKYYWMSDVEALRELLVDTLFIFNLTNLAVLLEEQYQFKEHRFWSLVTKCLLRYKQEGHTDEARISQIDIFRKSISTESLITKKLQQDPGKEFHHHVSNPLANAFSAETPKDKPPQRFQC